jgi:hypothetical protein
VDSAAIGSVNPGGHLEALAVAMRL